MSEEEEHWDDMTDAKRKRLNRQRTSGESNDQESREMKWGDTRNKMLQKEIDVMRDFLSTLGQAEFARWVVFSQAARHKKKD